MATPRLLSVRDFTTSRYSQLADTSSANISDTIARAEDIIERMIKRPILPTTYTEMHTVSRDRVYLRQRPVMSITEVVRSYPFSGAPFTSNIYIVDKRTGILSFMSGLNHAQIRVSYIAGFSEVPGDLKEAIIIQAAMLAFTDLEIYGSGDGKPPGILYLNDEIKKLVKPYRQLTMV